MNKYLCKYLFKVLHTQLLHNVIQENIEIIYFNWCMIATTKSFIEYIFFPNKWWFSLKTLNSTPYFIQWIEKNLFSFLKILQTHSLDFLTGASTVWQFYNSVQSCTSNCSRLSTVKFAKRSDTFLKHWLFIMQKIKLHFI